MEDVLGRAFASFMFVIGMFLIPVIFILNNYDIGTRSYVNNAVAEFTEAAMESGQITRSSYHQLCDALAATGDIYVIRMEHKSAVSVPAVDPGVDGITGTMDDEMIPGRYEKTYLAYNETDIINTVEGLGEDGIPETADDTVNVHGMPIPYTMKSGDQLSVRVESVHDTIGSRFFSAVTGNLGGFKLAASSGGIVGGR